MIVKVRTKKSQHISEEEGKLFELTSHIRCTVNQISNNYVGRQNNAATKNAIYQEVKLFLQQLEATQTVERCSVERYTFYNDTFYVRVKPNVGMNYLTITINIA